jgi:hypothetical protein
MGDTRQRADGLLDAPRVQAVPAPQVDEPIHARGNVNVRARALVAWGKGLSQEAPLDGSILGGHDLSWGAHHGIYGSARQDAALATGRRLLSGTGRDG